MEPWIKSYQNFSADRVALEEALLGLANGPLQSRAYFAEDFSGSGGANSYLSPFALVDWARMSLEIDGEKLDLAQVEVEDYQHQLNIREGHRKRSAILRLKNKHRIQIECTSFCCWEKPEILGLRYSISPLHMQARLQLNLELQAPQEKGWREVSRQNQTNEGFLLLQKNDNYVCSGMRYAIFQDAYKLECNPLTDSESGLIRHQISLSLPKASQTTIYKFTAHHHSGQYPAERLLTYCQQSLSEVFGKGFTLLLTEQAESWRNWWSKNGFTLEGDTDFELHSRFCHYHLRQLRGKSNSLLPGWAFHQNQQQGQNWGQEVFLLPYFLWQGEKEAALTILNARYESLEAAQSIAQSMGMPSGAALFPAQSWRGRESGRAERLNQQQIFRNGLVAWAIKYFTEHTGDQSFLAEKGGEMLVAIARFYAARINYSPQKQANVLLATTGPDEYESSVANNWLTNYLCRWTLLYAVEVLKWLREEEAVRYAALIGRTDLDFSGETRNWERIAEAIYLPEYPEMDLFLQQEGFLDKDQVQTFGEADLPIWQKWTEDRRLRAATLQQADVLWGFYLFPEAFAETVKKANYDFYAPKTVHEAPLSYPIHAILSAELGQLEEAMQYWDKERQKLENKQEQNRNSGISLPAMAGPQLFLIKGVLRAQIKDELLHLRPQLPTHWESLQLKLHWGKHCLEFRTKGKTIKLINLGDQPIGLRLHDQRLEIAVGEAYEL
ncbi:MAG: glycosyl hydrolase family 65 protein [Bacteroidota bacterium]